MRNREYSIAAVRHTINNSKEFEQVVDGIISMPSIEGDSSYQRTLRRIIGHAIACGERLMIDYLFSSILDKDDFDVNVIEIIAHLQHDLNLHIIQKEYSRE